MHPLETTKLDILQKVPKKANYQMDSYEICMDVHVTFRINCNIFGAHLTFHLMPSLDQHINLFHTLVDDPETWKTKADVIPISFSCSLYLVLISKRQHANLTFYLRNIFTISSYHALPQLCSGTTSQSYQHWLQTLVFIL